MPAPAKKIAPKKTVTVKTITVKTITAKTTATTKATSKTTAASALLEVGQKAPAFNMPVAEGKKISLAGLKGQTVLLYFYPKDDTPGCTVQACALRDNMPHFNKLKTTVIGVSKDPLKAHDKFTAKFGLNFTLASDADSDVAERYGVWVEKSMYGKKYMGLERSSFLIDGAGVIRAIWRKVKPEQHADLVLAEIKKLKL